MDVSFAGLPVGLNQCSIPRSNRICRSAFVAVVAFAWTPEGPLTLTFPDFNLCISYGMGPSYVLIIQLSTTNGCIMFAALFPPVEDVASGPLASPIR